MPVYHIPGFDARDTNHAFTDFEVGVRLVTNPWSVEVLALWEDARKVRSGHI